jgi:hypothetical protein
VPPPDLAVRPESGCSRYLPRFADFFFVFFFAAFAGLAAFFTFFAAEVTSAALFLRRSLECVALDVRELPLLVADSVQLFTRFAPQDVSFFGHVRFPRLLDYKSFAARRGTKNSV